MFDDRVSMAEASSIISLPGASVMRMMTRVNCSKEHAETYAWTQDPGG